MVSLYTLSKLSAERTSSRVKKSSESAPDFLRLYADKENLTFQERLIDACQKSTDNPKGVNELLFIALPERFLAKIIYLSIGKPKPSDKTFIDLASKANLNAETAELYLKQDDQTEFYNMESSNGLEELETILLCGGLSPVDDSIALLAELGRVFRVSKILNKPIKVMLADSEWMSSNKTIRQFKTLDNKTIKEGLEKCRDKKGKLYSNLKIEVELRQIVHYERKDSINSEKLEKISKYYIDLSKALWGNDSVGKKLEHEMVSLIAKPLDNITVLDTEDKALLPEHIRTLSQFPKVLKAIDDTLDEHLQILRNIAKQFNIFDDDTFSYFFAQYYAQDKYRGKVLKIAPITEIKFDKPFDELDMYFKTWGEGHSTKDLLAVTGLTALPATQRLSAIYYPHYQIGKYKVLPYTPLSLDFGSRQDKDHNNLYTEIILIDTLQDHSLITSILKETPLLKRNLLLSDLSWFILLVIDRNGPDYLDKILSNLNIEPLSKQFHNFSENLKNIYDNEIKYTLEGKIDTLWKSWFKKIQEDSKDVYIPLHLFFLLLDENDWDEKRIGIASGIIKSIIMIYKELIKT